MHVFDIVKQFLKAHHAMAGSNFVSDTGKEPSIKDCSETFAGARSTGALIGAVANPGERQNKFVGALDLTLCKQADEVLHVERTNHSL